MKYRVLVIDDDFANREEDYKILIEEDFNNELIFVKAETLEEIKHEAATADIVLLDIFLEEDAAPFIMNNQDVIDLIQEENENIPIYLITEYWANLEFKEYKDSIFRDRIVGGATLEQLKDRNERSKIRVDFKRAIFKNTKSVMLKLGPNEELNILHLSDLQFGGEWQKIGDDDKNPYSAVIEDIISSIPQQETGELIKTNLLIITGDIAQTGSPKEYYLAYKHLTRLCEALDIHKESRFIVPGNHDVSMPLSTAKKINVNLKAPKNKIKQNGNNYDHK
jgi:CheY-like chemotaxis protein